MDTVLSGKLIMSAIIFSLVGLLILFCSFIIFDKLTPGQLWKEIILDKNLPLAIVVGAFTIAIAQIIAAAIHG